MKTILTTILLLITVSGISQPLMLGCRKAQVKSEMRRPEYKRTVRASDYNEYQKGNTAYGFRYYKDTLHQYFGKWILYQFTVTMPVSEQYAYIRRMEACNCMTRTGDTWIWETLIFDTPVIIRRLYVQDEAGEDVAVSFLFEFDI